MAGKKIVKRVARKAAKKSNRKPKRSFSRYVAKALKNASGKNRLTLSSGAMRICNSFVADMIDRLGNGAASLARANKKRTMGSREVQAAVRLALPAELSKHSMAEATKAVARASA